MKAIREAWPILVVFFLISKFTFTVPIDREPTFFSCDLYSKKRMFSKVLLKDGEDYKSFIIHPLNFQAFIKIHNRKIEIKLDPQSKEYFSVTLYNLSANLLSSTQEAFVDCAYAQPNYIFKSQGGYFFRELGKTEGFLYDAALPRSPKISCYIGNVDAAIESLVSNPDQLFPDDYSRYFSLEYKEKINLCLKDKTLDLAKCLNDNQVPGKITLETSISRFKLEKKNIKAERAVKMCLDYEGGKFIHDDPSCTKWGPWKNSITEIHRCS